MLQYFETLTDDSGNSLLGATCQAMTYPGGTPAAIYNSNGTASPVANSTVASDITGQISFYAPDGAYTLIYSYQGSVYKTKTPVQMFDPLGFVSATDLGAASAYVITSSAYPASLYVGLKVEFKAANANIGASTLNLNATGAQPINLPGGTPIPAATIQAGGLYRLEWDGTQWQILGIALPLYAQTAAEVTAGVVPTAYFYQEGDIRRYGALIGAPNNALAINSALAVSAAGGSAAYIPPGSWVYTSTLNATLSSSMYGTGLSSALAPNACDGLTFGAPASYAGSRFFRDFDIAGTDTGSSNNGIIANFTAASGVKVIGIEFDNLTISGFAQGVFGRGFWFSTFKNCFLYNNYQGYYFNGQNVQIIIDGGTVQFGSAAGSGTSYGVLADSISGESTQALNIINFSTTLYNWGIRLGPCFNIVIENSTFNIPNNGGIQLLAINGGCTVKNNYIETSNGSFATIGIDLVDLGAATAAKTTIDNNFLICDVANAGSIGIYVGENHNSVTVTNNTVGAVATAFNNGIQVNANTGTVIAYNTIYATTNAVQLQSSSTNAVVEWNTTQNGTPLAFAGGTPTGVQYRVPGMRGTAAFVASTSVTVTIPTMPDTSYTVTLGGNANGYTWPVNKAVGQFVIDCSASNSSPTDWAICYG